MNSNYNKYLEYLICLSEANNNNITDDIYPMFEEFKSLFECYYETINKFKLIESDLSNFISDLDYCESDYSYFSSKLSKLDEIDKYLQELDNKNTHFNDSSIQDFIKNTYHKTQITNNLEHTEEEVLRRINQIYESSRKQKSNSGCMIIAMIIITGIFFGYTIF